MLKVGFLSEDKVSQVWLKLSLNVPSCQHDLFSHLRPDSIKQVQTKTNPHFNLDKGLLRRQEKEGLRGSQSNLCSTSNFQNVSSWRCWRKCSPVQKISLHFNDIWRFHSEDEYSTPVKSCRVKRRSCDRNGGCWCSSMRYLRCFSNNLRTRLLLTVN